jgi:hypothetical protein
VTYGRQKQEKKDEQLNPEEKLGDLNNFDNENELILSELLEDVETQDEKEESKADEEVKELNFDRYTNLDIQEISTEDDYESETVPEHPAPTPSNEFDITTDEAVTTDYSAILNEFEHKEDEISELQDEIKTDLKFHEKEPDDLADLEEEIPVMEEEPQEGGPLFEEPEFTPGEEKEAAGGSGEKPADEPVSYAEFIISDTPKDEGVPEAVDESGLHTNPPRDDTIEIGDEPKSADGSGLSYTDYIMADDEKSSGKDVAGGFEEVDGKSGAGEDGLKFDREDFVLDETDLTLAEGEDMALETDETEHDRPETTDTLAIQKDEFVVSGGDMGEETEKESDFLGLDNLNKPSDDSFLGVADIKEHKLPEIMLEGIEMDAEDQTRLVTRAEFLLAQGKKDKAAEIYSRIASANGVTPFVAKRLTQLNIVYSKPVPQDKQPSGK